MGWLEFVSKMTSALVWPVVVICLVLIFRETIRSLAQRTKELTLPGVSAKFDKEFERELASAANHAAKVAEKYGIRNREVDPDARRLALQAPAAAVALGYSDLEERLKIIATKLQIRGAQHGITIAQRLLREGYIDVDTLEILEGLRRARNAVLNNRKNPTTAEALEFLQQAAVFTESLNQVPKRAVEKTRQ